MRHTFSNSPRGRRAKAKYFATFYVTICLISAFAVLSLVTSLNTRYIQGQQYGVAQRRAIAELDVSWLARKDREVG
jgi:solute carrier family 24 (sodium/potassium/calcium exchanger), member 6